MYSLKQVVVCSCCAVKHWMFIYQAVSITLTFLKEIQADKRSPHWMVSSFWSHRSPNFCTNLVADPGEGPPWFETKLRPEEPKKFFWRPAPFLISGSGWLPPPPLISGSGWLPPPPLIWSSGSATVINLFSLIKLVYRVRTSVLLTSSNLILGSAFKLF